MAAGALRNLHWVLKIGDRTNSITFFKDVLLMTCLRHEEFKEGCDAACNGPYDGRWSKTMIGYGDEATNFVLELTYNYGVKQYLLGNDLNRITISSKAVFESVQRQVPQAELLEGGGALRVLSPDGYQFLVLDQDSSIKGQAGTISEVALNATDLPRSTVYWSQLLGSSPQASSSDRETVLSPGEGQAALRLLQLPAGAAVHHETAFGRIAFSRPGAELKRVEADSLAGGHTVLTPFVSLDTPGKASVQVVILADPDGHEICFVGDEGFRELSALDPTADELLQTAISEDKSNAWMERRARMEADMAARAHSGAERPRARLVVFVSGGGSNFKALHVACLDGSIHADIVAVVSDIPSCGGIAYAANLGIPTLTYPIPKSKAFSGLTVEQLVESLQVTHKADYVLLAGFLKLIPLALVQAFPRSMLNIHPALLPAFGGKGCYGEKVHKAVVAAGVRYTGATVHFVDEEFDSGAILAQRVVPVFPTDTYSQVAKRVLKQEHSMYPEAVAALVDGRVTWRADGVPIIWTAA
ncbi:MAG: hypothetical protein WDW36_003112 [Sanguina aurantia]